MTEPSPTARDQPELLARLLREFVPATAIS